MKHVLQCFAYIAYFSLAAGVALADGSFAQVWARDGSLGIIRDAGGLVGALVALLAGFIAYRGAIEATTITRRDEAISRLRRYLVAFRRLNSTFQAVKDHRIGEPDRQEAYDQFDAATRSSDILEMNIDSLMRGDRAALNYFSHHVREAIQFRPREKTERSMETVEHLSVEIATAIDRRIAMLERRAAIVDVCDVTVVAMEKYSALWINGTHINPANVLYS